MSVPMKTILSTQLTVLSSMESSNNGVASTSSSLISPMMTSLNSIALEKARSAIAKKFKDPIDLDELHLYTATLQKNLAVAESQLSSAVQVSVRGKERYVCCVYLLFILAISQLHKSCFTVTHNHNRCRCRSRCCY